MDSDLRKFLMRELRSLNRYRYDARSTDGQAVCGEYLRRAERTVEVVEDVLQELTPEHRRVIELMYLSPKRYTPDGVAMQAGYHRATVFRVCCAFLEEIALRMGYLKR